MTTANDYAVHVVEAAYDLARSPRGWLEHLIESGGALLDHGHGCIAIALTGVDCPDGRHEVPLFAHTGPNDWMDWLVGPVVDTGRSRAEAAARRQGASTARDPAACPRAAALIAQRDDVADVLQIWACDPGGIGVAIFVPSPVSITLSAKDAARWRMLASHISAGYRIRRALGLGGPGVCSETESAERIRSIRNEAVISDRAAAFESASDLVAGAKQAVREGEWSMVDWFDRGGRRLVLVKPNGPRASDPRALTPREYAVASYIARGDSGKIVGWRLGISRALVSSSLRSAMRKLSVKTHAHLVVQMRCLGDELEAS